MNDKVSIIIPVYNVAQYIAQCFHSLCQQTYTNLELIFVDDCSTDDSLSVLQKKRLSIPRSLQSCIRIVELPVNGGLGNARNEGLKMATGKWCLFVDSDDWVEPNYVKAFMDFAPQDGDLIDGGVIYEYGTSSRRLIFEEERVLIAKASPECIGFHLDNSMACGKLLDLNLIKNRNLQFKNITPQEDTAFIMEYIAVGKCLCSIRAANYHYRKNVRNSLTTKIRSAQEYIAISDILFACWDLLLDGLVHISKRDLACSIHRYGLSQLILAYRSCYLSKENEKRRRLVVQKMRLHKHEFIDMYEPRSMVIRWFTLFVLYAPWRISDAFARVMVVLLQGRH